MGPDGPLCPPLGEPPRQVCPPGPSSPSASVPPPCWVATSWAAFLIAAPPWRHSMARHNKQRDSRPASLLQALLSVRSERQLMEQITYNRVFGWFRPVDGMRRFGT